MKRILLASCMVLAAATAFGQEQKGPAATSCVLDQQPAVMIVLPYTPKAVLEAMTEYEMNSYRLAKNQAKEYQAIDNTPLMQQNKADAPLVLRVGPHDAYNKNKSVVYLMLNSPVKEGYYAGTTQYFNANDAIAYLNNLATAVQVITLDKQIKQQTAMLRKLEQKQAACEKRCTKLDSKKIALQQKTTMKSNGYTTYRNKKVEGRLTERQAELAIQKAKAEQYRQDLAILTKKRSQR